MNKRTTKKNVMTRLLASLICFLLIATLCPIATVAETNDTDTIPDLSAYVTNPIVSLVTDFDTTGAGSLTFDSEKTTASVETSDSGDKRINVTKKGDWVNTVTWNFTGAQNWSELSIAGVLVKVDFSKANNPSGNSAWKAGQGVSVGIHTKDGEDVETVFYNDAAWGGYAYNDATSSWTKMMMNPEKKPFIVVNYQEYTKYTGYIYIPYSNYDGVANLDKVSAISFYLGTYNSGTAYVDGFYLVKGTESIGVDVDLSAYVKNAEITTVTNFKTGSLAYNSANTNAAIVTSDSGNKRISVEKVDGQSWVQSFDWTLAETQDWTGAAGVLVKVDYRNANSGTNGGHGVSIGIHTKDMGTTVSYNDPSFGGYAYTAFKDQWQEMEACVKYPELLVVDPDVYKCYAGYIYIPLGTFEGLSGLDEVTALTVYAGATTSGTGYIDSIYLVKGDVVPAIEVTATQDTITEGTETYYNLRFLATVNTLGVKSYGFTLTAAYTDSNGAAQTVTKTYSDQTTVYNRVKAGDEYVNTPDGMYYAPLTVTGIPKDVTVTFTVIPSLTLLDDTVVSGEKVEYTITAASSDSTTE